MLRYDNNVDQWVILECLKKNYEHCWETHNDAVTSTLACQPGGLVFKSLSRQGLFFIDPAQKGYHEIIWEVKMAGVTFWWVYFVYNAW